MPKGIPVATVGIDASRNAAILACEILSIKYDRIMEKLKKMKTDMQRLNEEKSIKVNSYLQD
jgi:5-(carboxyamino)imidazole ribonucleotide mutase